jgi:XisI protein
MDNELKYANILTEVVRKEAAIQPRSHRLTIDSVCDKESGKFLIIMNGWEKETWLNTILFYAHLLDGKIVIEDDNFEEGLTPALLQAGIPREDIINGLSLESDSTLPMGTR